MTRWDRRTGTLLVFVVSYLALLPLVNSKFRTLVTIRYLMPLLPIIAVLIASGATDLIKRLCRDRVWLRRLGYAGLFGILVIPQVLSLQRYYERALVVGDTNERIFRLSSVIQAERQPHELVIVDDGLGAELPGTGVTELRGFRYLLTMADIPHQVIRFTPRRLEDELGDRPSVLAILNARDAESVERRLRLESVEGRTRAVIGRGSDYQVYRVRR